MMTHHEPHSPTDDQLVARCRNGDRFAFEVVVTRYKSMLCALTYAGCGDVHRSEDLAQEAFLQAWRHLGELKEPARLKAWLCGIARNVMVSDHRKQGRSPAAGDLAADAVLCAATPTPPEEAIRREEQVLLWETLERLPAEYREPLVLFYRQEESVAAVAEALELSEEAVRQRLSRGRAMLAQRLEHVIRRGLRTTAPTKAFTLAVVAALPGVAVTVASAATLSAAAATTTKTAASTTAATTGGLVGMLLGPLIGLAGGYIGYRVGMEQAVTGQERRLIRWTFWTTMVMIAGFTLVFCTVSHWARWLGLTTHTLSLLLVGLALGYAVMVLFLWARYARRLRRMRAVAVAENPERLAAAQAMCVRWRQEYRSRWTLFGLPLVHVILGPTPEARMPVARGWIAIGGKAYGVLFACGGVAVGAISFGGAAVGLLTFGGVAAGALSLGGFSVGVWALGGMAVGCQAMGGCALAWSTAVGGIAVAHEYAWGGAAAAANANDVATETHLRGNGFFRLANGLFRYAWLLWMLAFLPSVPIFMRWRRLRKSARVGDPGERT